LTRSERPLTASPAKIARSRQNASRGPSFRSNAGGDLGAKPFDPTDAGIAEAVICLALLWGASALVLGLRNARTIALGTVTFAILGFLVGLNFTIRAGDAIDIAYHLAVLPLLVLTLLLVRNQVGRPRPLA
jgi:hypothetical protein